MEPIVPRKQTNKDECPHPITRQFAWHAFDGTLVVCCCECGKVLRGVAEVQA